MITGLGWDGSCQQTARGRKEQNYEMVILIIMVLEFSSYLPISLELSIMHDYARIL
jgi:hypothetical protein